MADLDELLARAAAGSPDPGRPVPTVVVGAEDVVRTLVQYFGEDDERQAVRLVVDGTAAGYLRRADLYAYVGSVTRGFGSSDAYFAPGPTRPVLRAARCPVDGAGFRVARFRADKPPSCPDHGAALELVG